ncbi:polysaccharide deacetylase family protein [Clostridium sp. MCC353]|nr:polysaccharide deacetylase family protein [Clostridium sp. MCC353]
MAQEPASSETVPVKVDALGSETEPLSTEVHILPDVEIDPEVPTVPAVVTENPQNQGGNPQNQSGISQAQSGNPQAQSGASQTQNGLPQVLNGAPQAQTTEIAEQAPALQSIPSPGFVDPSKPMIAFTFDDGPYTKVDKKILDVLEAHGGRATFFIVGSRVEDYKETLKRIYNSGSEIGNHTFNHKNLEKITPEEVVSQVEMTNDAVAAVTGFRPKLVRVPYGAYQGQVTGLVNYPLIQWNVDTEDWKNKDKASALDSILSHAKDGNIILMHDLYPSTAEAFEEAVPLLTAQGFQLVTVSEMYAAKGIEMEAGKVYFNVK